eukprot:TRINITY_DN4847_c0_g1_i2.p1 TRINITY_DN4847_c0_g1~~TRINITY_DN4847_c0_g1_i2.p1  ORF type:complete len:267 (+),score=52.82 TRINITY_DN4847_c0_g1_i2:110-910(+)
MLLLYLQIAPSDDKVPVELPLDATVGELKAAAHGAGGPPPHEQVLAIGAEDLSAADGTPLSDTHLVSNEVVISVWRRLHGNNRVISCGYEHGLVLLDSGEVAGWGSQDSFSPMPGFGGNAVSVHAGLQVSAAIAAGKLVVWGEQARRYVADLEQLESKEVVCCSAAVYAPLICAVTSDGDLFLCGEEEHGFTTALQQLRASGMQGSIAAVSVEETRVVVISREGAAAVLRPKDQPMATLDLPAACTRPVTSVRELCPPPRAPAPTW